MTLLDVVDGTYSSPITWGGMVRQDTTALLAATFPVRPPRRWFDQPSLEGPTPLTIQSDGHVFGHIATWKQSHIGMIGKVNAPRGRAGYAFYATGAIPCDDDSMVNVGQITLTGGHAPLEASVAEAVAHYDDTRSAFADVTVGEDDHGIWVAGALRPDVNEIQLRAIRASSVSGDWRPINGNLELVAVCAVNVPGFPIPRARVASGQVVALVAAGTEELAAIAMFDHLGIDMRAVVAAATGDIDRRLALVEDALLDRARERRAGMTAALENSSDFQFAELRARVHGVTNGDAGEVVTSEESVLASLRDRVHTAESEAWEDGMPLEWSTAECIQASLRSRVRGMTAGGMVATSTKAWDADKRKKAASSGAAMPGGRYPIKDCADVGKAVKALGRGKGSHAAIKRHIIKRAKSLGCMSDLPDDWKKSSTQASAAPQMVGASA